MSEAESNVYLSLSVIDVQAFHKSGYISENL